DKEKFYYGNLAFLEILHIDKVDINSKPFPHFIKDKKLREFFIHCNGKEERVFFYKGTHIIMKSFPYIENGENQGNIFILNDITDIKDSETQLRDLKTSLDMIEDILEYAYEGFVLVDKDGKIAKMNYEKLMGLKEEDNLGKPVEDVIENTRMHIVVKTGEKELRDVQR